MSGFRESFTRNSGADGSLQHDDTAFGFFFISILTTISIPLTIHLIKQIFNNPASEFVKRAPQTETAKQKCEILLQETQYDYLTPGYFLKILILIILVITIKSVYNNVINNQDAIKRFDPYEILEIDRATATQADIKQAHRKMSLKWHPDKNPDNPEATAIFILVSKAYECLTDESKKHLCEKFGNPDGNKSTQVAIALPKFLLYKENQIALLVIFFLILLVVIPTVGYLIYNESIQKDENGVYNDNKGWFFEKLNENLIIQNCVEILAGAQQYQEIPFLNQQQKDIGNIINMLNDTELAFGVNPTQTQPIKSGNQFVKAKALISAHLFNYEIPESLKQDYDKIITIAPAIIQSMISFALNFQDKRFLTLPDHIKKRYRGQFKYMGIQCLNSLIDFQQLMVQGLWWQDPSIFQLSAFSREKDATLRRIKKIPELLQLIKTPREQRKLTFLPDQYINQTNDQIDCIPNLQVDWKVEVPEEDTIAEGDVVKITITLDRLHFKDDQDVKYASSSCFPHFKQEKWHIIINQNEGRVNYHLLQGFKQKLEISTRRIEQAGENQMTLSIKSDCYRGVDQEHKIKFKVLPIKEVQRKFIQHEEDQQLDKTPSFFSQLLQNLNNRKDDSDEELEDDEAQKDRKKQKQELQAMEDGELQDEEDTQEGNDQNQSETENNEKLNEIPQKKVE